MVTAYGYNRVSHLDSVNSGRSFRDTQGLSLGTQEDTIRHKFNELKLDDPDLEWGGIFTDPAVSAYKTPFAKRPAGGRLLVRVKPGDIIIFARFDRAFRSMMDCFRMIERWEKEKVRIVFCDQSWDTKTASGRFMMSIFAALAEFYSANISERTKEGLARKRELEQFTGGHNPKGMKVIRSKELGASFTVPNPEYIEMAELAWKLHNEGVGRTRITDHIEDFLAKKEGRKSFATRKIRSCYRHGEEWVRQALSFMRDRIKAQEEKVNGEERGAGSRIVEELPR